MSDQQARLDELNRLIGQLDVRDAFIQAEVVVQLHNCWDLLNDLQKQAYLKKVAPFITRTRGAASETGLLLSILKLPTEEDIRRALSVDVGVVPMERGVGGREEPTDPDYLWAPQEEIYREATGWFRDYLNYAKGNYVPLGFHFWSAVCLLGAVCKRQIYFDAGQFPILANAYVLLVGDSSTGKSAAAKIAVDIIDRLNRQICPSSNEIERLPYGRQFVNCLPNDVTVPRIVSKLSSLRYCPGNPKPHTGPDGIASSGVPYQPVDATAFIYIDELANLFGKETYKPATVASFFTQIKESDKYEKSTNTDGDKYLYNVAVSMIACCAPPWLKEAISPTILGGGFADRTNYVFREPVWQRMKVSSPHRLKPRDPVAAEWLASELRVVAELETKKVPTLTPDALEVGDKLFTQLVEEMELRYSEVGSADDITSASRAYNHILRLAFLLAVGDTIGTVKWPRITCEVHHINLAARIMRMEEFSMRRFLERAQEENISKAMRRLLKVISLMEDCVARGDFTKVQMKGIPVDEYLPHAKQLIEEGRLECVQLGTARRWRLPNHRCVKCSAGVEIPPERLRW